MKKDNLTNYSIVYLFALLFLGFTSIGQTTKGLHREKVSNHLSMLLPDKFMKLEDREALDLFGMAQLPMAIYCNEDKKVSLTCHLKKVAVGTEVEDDERNYTLEKSFLKSSIASLYKKIDFAQDTVMMVYGKETIVFEFVATIEGEDAQGNKLSTNTYNYIAYFLFRKKTYVVNFACPSINKDLWHEKAGAIVNSIKVE